MRLNKALPRLRPMQLAIATAALCLFGCGSALAAPEFIQSNYATPQSPQASVSVTYSGAQTAGNLNVVAVGWNDGTSTVQSISDLRGNVYKLAAGPTVISKVESQAIYYSPNIVASGAGANKVTVTFSSSAVNPDVRVAEYSGIDPNNSLDVVKSASGTNGTSSSGAVSTTFTNDLLVGANLVQTLTTSAGAGYTSRIITKPDGDILQDQIVTATGSYTATAPLSAPGPWIMQLVAFRAIPFSGGGGADITPPTAPGGLSAVAASSGQINVSWSASTDNVGVTGYVLERCQGSTCTSFAQVAAQSATSYTDSGLIGSTTYRYRVSARDAANNHSAYSTTASATTQAPVADTSHPIAYIQGAYATPQTSQTSVRVAFAGSQTAGNLNVVVVGWNDSSSAVKSVVDSRGNAYQLVVGPSDVPNMTQAIYYASNIASSAAGTNSVTVTFVSAAQAADIRIAEYSGIDPNNPVDAGIEASGSGTTSSSGSVVTRNANDLLVSANLVQTMTGAAGSGYTARVITSPDGDILEDRIVSATGTYGATATLTSRGAWVSQLVAFRGTVLNQSASQTVPGTPGSVSAVGGNASISVTWTAPSDGGSPITGYTVTANPGGMSETVGTASTAATLSGLTNGTSYTVSVYATNSLGSSPAATSAAVTPTAGSTSTSPFPVVHSSSQRYLQNQSGSPLPILGRTAWFVISLSTADYQQFIDDTVSRGYNTVEMHVPDHDPRGNRPPFDGNGDVPFLKRLDGGTYSGALTYSNINNEAPDFTTPNPAFWAYMDNFLAYCESKGVLVLMFPSYMGYAGGNQGWAQEMVANGSSRMNTYGAWIATRYRNQRNLVWMAGGDMGSFSSDQSSAENGLLTGIRSITGKQSSDFSAEWDTDMIASDQGQFGSLMTLNGAYSWKGDVSNQGRRAYGHSPTSPAFLLEEPYDEEGADGNDVNPNATQPVRRFQWWGWLSTIGGYVSGNGYVWPFSNPNWKSHLNTEGSRDMAQLNAFVKSIAWYQLVPSGLGGTKTIVTSGGGSVSGPDYVAAAATPTGSLIVAYVPPGHSGSLTIDMTRMAGTAEASWFNPTTGAYTNIGSFGNGGPQTFNPPGSNGTGYSDWVLVIQR